MRAIVRVESGSGSVWLLCLLGALSAATMASLAVGPAVVARHRAGTVADLAALAGAVAQRSGDPAACSAAARVAAGTLAKLLLGTLGVQIVSHVVQMGPARAAAGRRPRGRRKRPPRRRAPGT